MSRLIDADLLKAGFEEDGHLSPYIEGFIDACPTVETVKCSKWISVKDRLPEEGQYVLVFVNGLFGLSMVYDKDMITEEPIWSYTGLGADPEYWMLLPEPPKEE